MRKTIILLLLSSTVLLQLCSTRKRSEQKAASKITYEGNIKALVVNNCSPCHIPGKGNKKPYDTFAAVKGDIDEILTRINKNPGEKGFMPARHPKLSDSTINVFVKWKNAGTPEQ